MVATDNLAIGVGIGVLLSAVFFAAKVQKVTIVESSIDQDGLQRKYRVRGQLFFASSDALIGEFDFKEPIESVVLDLTHAHFWDITAVDALDRIVHKFRRNGIKVEVTGLNRASATLIEQFATHDKAGHAGGSGMGH